jgi:tetratricopeptide (TPR) repeat protein
VLADFAGKLLLVVGHAKFTPDGFEWGERGLSYLDAVDGGDGRVTLASALLPGVRTWTLDCEHGSLPSATAAFGAFAELLMRGDTTQLQRLSGGTRSAVAAQAAVVHVRSRPSRARPRLAPAASVKDLLGAPRDERAEESDTSAGGALRVSVVNGNLSFVHQPLLVGHYRSLALTGTERVIDGLIGGAMSAALSAGLYPNEPGTHQVFVNTRRVPDSPWQVALPSSAIVIGLGDEGKLRETALAMSVRQGVIAWSQRVAEQPGGAPAQFEIAATLMGSGGLGISAGAAARAIALGVREANNRLIAAGWPSVSHLLLVELYLERATDAWRGLQLLGEPGGPHFDIAPTVLAGSGPLRRQIDNGYRGTNYDLITATTPEGANGTISYTLDTRRARAEVRAQVTQGPLLRELVGRASTDSNDDPQIGRTLFQLLVPPELEPFLSGTSHMLLELDPGTAAIPWELLDTTEDKAASGDARPWAVRCQLMRKLRLEDYRERVQDASADDAVLVIGEPKVDLKLYAELPGALAEAKAVVQQFTGPGGIAASRVVRLVDQDDAAAITNALLKRRYRIVHIAGHGEPGGAGGVVMSGGTFLGPREIKTMRTVPELVFVNCCHLAARDAGETLRSFDRPGFAANVAESLIGIGVRCVIAAGWAVEDAQAETFATTFYRELLAGAPFIRAVSAAREAAWQMGGNTWAAYQCYGDPNWVFDPEVQDAQRPRTSPADEYAGISSPLDLALALEELAVQSRWQGTPAERQRAKIGYLEARFGGLWGSMGAVAEAFGLACAEAGDVEASIGWYEAALQCNDASASLKAAEQLGNLRARRAWHRASAVKGPASDKAIAEGRQGVESALALLQPLAALQPTIERLSLCGSAWKRLAMIEALAARPAEERAAIVRMTESYRQAEQLAANSGHPELHYPALNRMAGEVVVEAGNPGWVGIDPASIAAARACLQAQVQASPDFWSVAGLVELVMLEAIGARTPQGTAARALAQALAALEDAFAELHRRVAAPRMWASVADQAHFVLAPYAHHCRGSERVAATRLLGWLNAFAGWDWKYSTAGATASDAGTGLGPRGAPSVLVLHRHDTLPDNDDDLPGKTTHAAHDLAVELEKRGLSVWTSLDFNAVPISKALETAVVCVVFLQPGRAASAADGARERSEWTFLASSFWERSQASQAMEVSGESNPGKAQGLSSDGVAEPRLLTIYVLADPRAKVPSTLQRHSRLPWKLGEPAPKAVVPAIIAAVSAQRTKGAA